MEVSGYIVIKKKYRYPYTSFTKITQKKPDIRKDEVAVKICLQLPKDVFDDVVPELQVKASIDSILSTGIKASIECLTDDGLAELERKIAQEVANREAGE